MRLENKNSESKLLTIRNNKEKSHFKLIVNFKNKKFINNVNTISCFNVIDNAVYPFTVNNKIDNNSYVCSIYTAIILYSLQEVKKINNFLLRCVLKIIILILNPIFRVAKIEKIVATNNFLLSTNIFPKISICSFKNYFNKMIKRYPDHLILVRSLNMHLNETLLIKLKELGFKLVPSRQVYIFDKKIKDYTQAHNFKIDTKFMNSQKIYKPCFLMNASLNDYKRIAQLYFKLYILKYSEYNPVYNENYIEFTHKNKLINYTVLRNENGIIDAVIGFYERDGLLTAPIVGYDTDLPKRFGLYRILMAFAINRAYNENKILNLSSGASHFKILRGGVPFIEYSAIYFEHLSNKFQKSIWIFLSYILIRLAEPIFKKYKL